MLKSRSYNEVISDIKAVKKACGNIPLKVIIEAMMLSDEQIAGRLQMRAGRGRGLRKKRFGILPGTYYPSSSGNQ